jgi:hypothetical protein
MSDAAMSIAKYQNELWSLLTPEEQGFHRSNNINAETNLQNGILKTTIIYNMKIDSPAFLYFPMDDVANDTMPNIIGEVLDGSIGEVRFFSGDIKELLELLFGIENIKL